MAWRVTARISYSGDSYKRQNPSTGKTVSTTYGITGNTTKALTTSTAALPQPFGRLHQPNQRSATGVYVQDFTTQSDAQAAMDVLVKRLFNLHAKVKLDHLILTIFEV